MGADPGSQDLFRIREVFQDTPGIVIQDTPQDHFFEILHGQAGILPVVMGSPFLKVRFNHPSPFEIRLVGLLDEVKELFHRPFQFRPVRRKMHQGHAQVRDLPEGLGNVFASHIGDQGGRELAAVPCVPFYLDPMFPAVFLFIRQHVQHQATEAVRPSFPGQHVATAETAVSVHAGGQDGTPHKPSGLVDQVDIADCSVQHADPHRRGKRLYPIPQQGAVVPLVSGLSVPGNILPPQVLVFPVKVAELMDGRILRKQLSGGIAVPFL